MNKPENQNSHDFVDWDRIRKSHEYQRYIRLQIERLIFETLFPGYYQREEDRFRHDTRSLAKEATDDEIFNSFTERRSEEEQEVSADLSRLKTQQLLEYIKNNQVLRSKINPDSVISDLEKNWLKYQLNKIAKFKQIEKESDIVGKPLKPN